MYFCIPLARTPCIIILRDHHRVSGPSLTETSLCGAPRVHCHRLFPLPPGVNPIAVDKYMKYLYSVHNVNISLP